jgi:hypothetical protein
MGATHGKSATYGKSATHGKSATYGKSATHRTGATHINKMKQYLQLQYKLLLRQFKDFGIEPTLGAILVLISFILFSLSIFVKLPYAPYFYALVPFSFITILAAKNRNDFLKIAYPKNEYIKIRVVENILLIIPFIIFLLFKQCFLVALLLPICTTLFVFIKTNNNFNPVIPTPFYKNPFEFIVGFRKSFFVIVAAYFIAFMAIKVNNVGLGYAVIILLCFVCSSFYSKPEPAFYVWQSSRNPKTFIHQKMALASLHFSLLLLPIVIVFCFRFPSSISNVLLIFFAGLFFVLTSLLSKYASFPQALSPTKAMALMFTAWFPPLLIVFTYVFYFQSIKSLQTILK